MLPGSWRFCCVQLLQPTSRGASSAAAKIYSNDALFGPIPVGFRVVQALIAGYGVLTWRTSPYARHVFDPASILHAVNRPLIREVSMACNTPTHGYLDCSFTDLTAVSKWRATRYSIFSQRCWMHPNSDGLSPEPQFGVIL